MPEGSVCRTEICAHTTFGAEADTRFREAGKRERNLEAVNLLV